MMNIFSYALNQLYIFFGELPIHILYAFKNCVIFLLLSFKSSSSTLDTALIWYMIWKYFLFLWVGLFMFLILPFDAQKF